MLNLNLIRIIVLSAGGSLFFTACNKAIGKRTAKHASVNTNLQIDNTPPSKAVALTWYQSSPSLAPNITAIWSTSDASDLSNQVIQFFDDDHCGRSHGSPVDLASSVANSYSQIVNDVSIRTYKINSIDKNGNSGISDCSVPMIVNSRGLPTVSISNPLNISMNKYQSYSFVIQYSNVTSIDLQVSDLVPNYSGFASCSAVHLTGSSASRIVTFSNCTGIGTASLSVKPGTSSNISGNDAGAGPSNTVAVNNPIIASCEASSYGYVLTGTFDSSQLLFLDGTDITGHTSGDSIGYNGYLSSGSHQLSYNGDGSGQVSVECNSYLTLDSVYDHGDGSVTFSGACSPGGTGSISGYGTNGSAYIDCSYGSWSLRYGCSTGNYWSFSNGIQTVGASCP